MTIKLELNVTLDDDAKGELCRQFSFSVDYDGGGVRSAFFVFRTPQTKVKYVKIAPIFAHSKAINPLFYRLTYK